MSIRVFLEDTSDPASAQTAPISAFLRFCVYTALMSIEFKRAELSNGLTILAECDPDAHTAAVGFFVKAGARDEDTAVMGVSHFLEHMMFKGTARRTAEQVDEQFDDLGADHNAYTTSEMTAFYAHCLPEKLESAAEILADILRPALRDGDFDDEKKVILEEIAMYHDQPFWVLYEQLMESYYREHPLSHRVLGTEQTIALMRSPQMREYFDHWYSADNTVVAMAGRVDFDAMARRVEHWCGRWNRTGARRSEVLPVIEPDELTIHSGKVHVQYGMMLSPAPALQDDRRYAAGALSMILGDDEGSRLYWSLIETGLADEAAASYDGRDGLGQYIVHWVCAPDNAEQVERVIREEIDNLIGSLAEDDLERMRNKIATAATLQGELPAGRMRRLGTIWTYRRQYRTLEEELARINAVTLDDLRAVHRDFPITPLVVGRLTPGES